MEMIIRRKKIKKDNEWIGITCYAKKRIHFHINFLKKGVKTSQKSGIISNSYED